ncbi:hypothetical protein HYH03_007314 [Edaphochlamys debaryana]|uniref:Uncharacterized protein n=1 Tax=Edaphochlamys debaryana TaxID=47281 RepID=A0A836C026_9CHLO|nr:hypothetical protein HYH03_007314 [Edaphochlamys debaryana]|eukprot:KAG2494547.1 hypothetical protein HYH03_007314 [Edaphochlamys debaryana]
MDFEASALFFLFPLLAICGISITVLAVIRHHLANVDVYCWNYPNYYSCATFYGGCMVSNNPFDYQPCNYAYAVGAISLFSSIVNMCICCEGFAAIMSIVGGIWHAVWWCVAAAYFTTEWQDSHALPDDYWRHVLMGVSWAAFCMGILQLVMAIGLCVMKRRRKHGDNYEAKSANPAATPVGDTQG